MEISELKELASNCVHLHPYTSNVFPPSLYYRFLYALARKVNSTLCVELGVCGGGGSLHMALGSSFGKVIGVDITNDYPTHIELIKRTVSNFTFLQMDSIDAVGYIRNIIDSCDFIDILFIDTVHTYERTIAEYNAYKPLMKCGSFVVLDDLFREGMDAVWDEMPFPKVRLDTLHIGGSPTDGGFGVVML